ncbi:MAG: outer membrane lipoprotein-sorting protein [Deltaproteobacteria bacterium]|nr:outer membrane lipoprotein-sorting protein [Deltaproteobacteria bacterium]
MTWLSRSALLCVISVFGAGLGVVVAVSAVRAEDRAPVETVQDILNCVSENTPKNTARQTFNLMVHDRGGGVQTLEAELQWKRDEKNLSRILVRLSGPPDLRGSSYLMIEREKQNDMFAYLPELKLVRRVTGRHSAGSVFGSDFSYEDMERLYNISQTGESKRLADEEISGNAVFVVETFPAEGEQSSYQRTVTYVDQRRCVTLKTVFYESADQVRKTLLADVSSIEQVGGIWIPKKVRIEDLRTQTHTELEVGKIEFDVEIPDRVFTRSSLERKGR